MWFGAFSEYPYQFKNLNRDIDSRRMWTLPGTLCERDPFLEGTYPEKLNFKFVINSKTDFWGGQVKKLHFGIKLYILEST